MRLLVIEDDATLRESLAARLVDTGFAVEQAADGKEHDGDHGVGLDQFFGGQVDLETGGRTGSKFCCCCHVTASSFDHVDLANHVVVADPAEFVTYDAVLAGPIGLDRNDHVVTGVYLDIDVDRL